MIITCLVCGKEGKKGDVHSTGWFLAANRIGGYTCSPHCDGVILAYDEARKKEAKAKKKVKSQTHDTDPS